ncbi:MAG: sulfonate transport system permease protein [Trebonia sp.]|jgi:NitT/TauT family transport system permease protein|nr:sulfonate transport system permease protein [Trebonia sp.]
MTAERTDQGSPTLLEKPATTRRSRPKKNRRASAIVNLWRLACVVVVLAAWQYLPDIGWLSAHYHVFDPFFISSPSRVASNLGKLATGSDGVVSIWAFLWYTVKATAIGVAIGVGAGVVLALIFSQYAMLAKILSPFISFVNATPRIALIPIFVILVGPTITMSVITAFLVVFFIAFYNGLTGGLSIPRQIIDNARLLGASSTEIALQIRLPYVLAWVCASLPNAISFGLVTVVTAEILTGQPGMGQLITTALTNSDASLTFSVVITLAVVGSLFVFASELLQRRLLHWWER